MKSAVFYGRHDLRVEERPIPEVGPQDVLIQVKPAASAERMCIFLRETKGLQR